MLANTQKGACLCYRQIFTQNAHTCILKLPKLHQFDGAAILSVHNPLKKISFNCDIHTYKNLFFNSDWLRPVQFYLAKIDSI